MRRQQAGPRGLKVGEQRSAVPATKAHLATLADWKQNGVHLLPWEFCAFSKVLWDRKVTGIDALTRNGWCHLSCVLPEIPVAGVFANVRNLREYAMLWLLCKPTARERPSTHTRGKCNL
ncbi:hypothetical protein H8959_000893 [Pygathrix nigripes]